MDRDIYPEVIRRAGNDLGKVAQDLGNRVHKLFADIQGLGSPWGHDEIGEVLGPAYLSIEFDAEKTLESVTKSIEEFGVNLIDWAIEQEHAEQSITDDFKQIGEGLGGP